MELHKVTGLVLASLDYKEKDKLIKLFTCENGKISVIARGCNSIKSKLNSATLNHTLARYELVHKVSLPSITGYQLIDSFKNVDNDINKYYVSEIILEITDKILNENDLNEHLFLYLLKYYKILCYENVDYKIIIIHFLLYILKENSLDIIYNLDCGICNMPIKHYKFSYNNLTFICNDCKVVSDTTVTFNEQIAIILNAISHMSIDKLSNCSIIVSNNDFTVIMRHLYVMLNNFLKIKSNAIIAFMNILQSITQ